MALSDDDVREILRLIDGSDLEELRIETEGLSLHVRKGGAPAAAEPPAAATSPSDVAPPAAPPPSDAAAQPTASPPPEGSASAAPAAAPAGSASPNGEVIAAPMLGTFYRAEAPGRPPFVEVGSEVEPSTVVGLIEVMKMMNSIRAGVAGTVVEVCAENDTVVETDAPLFRVRPA
ncbi:MAG TPA: acetyl-CoA carboxylase biotin carboxyl carrier protein [Solirubrobacteraceae bacterium]